MVLNTATLQDDTFLFFSIEALSKHSELVKRQFIEELALLAANGPTNRKAALEIIEILDPEIIRRWPLLSCEFRHQYRKLSYL